MSDIISLREQIRSCTKCELYKKMPEGCKPVPGIGPLNAKLFIIGEALGADEALIEEPFVGLCGKFLTKCMIDAGLERSSCYISNVVKCRPTDTGKKNRPPSSSEVLACIDWLFKEIEIIKPKGILTLGKFSAKMIRKEQFSTIKQIVGQEGDYNGIKVISTWHPSYIQNYSQGHMKQFIEHLKLARKFTYDI
jgi:uracil-DNA glycosylase family 4